MRKTDVLKICWKSKLPGKKNWRNAPVLKRKKVQGIFGETFILSLLSFAYKTVSQNYFNLFYLGDKGPLLEFLGKWGWLPLKHSLLVIWHINAVRKTSIKKHEKSSRIKNFRQFRGFALDYESEESAETWENFVLFING